MSDPKQVKYMAVVDIYTQLSGSVAAGDTVTFPHDHPDAKVLLEAGKLIPFKDDAHAKKSVTPE